MLIKDNRNFNMDVNHFILMDIYLCQQLTMKTE
jgi:hypothetical protein